MTRWREIKSDEVMFLSRWLEAGGVNGVVNVYQHDEMSRT